MTEQVDCIGYRLSVIGYRLSVIGYRLSVVSCRLSVVGCRLSVVGWLFVVAWPRSAGINTGPEGDQASNRSEILFAAPVAG